MGITTWLANQPLTHPEFIFGVAIAVFLFLATIVPEVAMITKRYGVIIAYICLLLMLASGLYITICLLAKVAMSFPFVAQNQWVNAIVGGVILIVVILVPPWVMQRLPKMLTAQSYTTPQQESKTEKLIDKISELIDEIRRERNEQKNKSKPEE